MQVSGAGDGEGDGFAPIVAPLDCGVLEGTEVEHVQVEHRHYEVG